MFISGLFLLFLTSHGLAADVARWPVGLEQLWEQETECHLQIRESVPPLKIQEQRELYTKFMQFQSRQYCLMMKIKDDWRLLGSSKICPGVGLENFQVCYSKTLRHLIHTRKIGVIGLVLLQGASVVSFLKQKSTKAHPPEEVQIRLLEVTLLSAEEVRALPLPSRTYGLGFSAPAVSAAVAHHDSAEKVAIFSLVRWMHKTLEKGLGNVEKGFAKQRPKPRLAAWLLDLKRRAAALKRVLDAEKPPAMPVDYKPLFGWTEQELEKLEKGMPHPAE
jgi:hypothetical protein